MITGRYDRYLKPKHKFEWTVKGWGRINRYGDRVEEPEVLGASEKEFEEILAEAIENWGQRPIVYYYSWIGGSRTNFIYLNW
jgi:hypothetical protein